MANQQIIAMKAARTAEISEKIKKAQSVIIFDYRGLTVEQDTALRNKMREAHIEYVVLKNSMVERAARDCGVDEAIHQYLKGPNAFAFGYEDAVAPAKILKDTVKGLKKCELMGGIVNGKVFNGDEVNQLADLPSREVLIARLLGSMLSPISKLANVLDQIRKQKEGPVAE